MQGLPTGKGLTPRVADAACRCTILALALGKEGG
jgi:hypothetical protein